MRRGERRDGFVGIVNKGWNWANATPQRKRMTRVGLGVAIVAAIPAIWLAWYLGSPLFIDDVANEDFPLTANATIPENVTREAAEAIMATAAKIESPMDESMTDKMESASTVSLISGSFRDEDRLHKGSGTARIYRL